MSIQSGGLLFLFLGIILFAATRAGFATGMKAGYGLSAFFIVYGLLFGIAGFFDSELMLLLLLPLPVGIGMTLLGFWMIFKGFFYSLEMDGTYMECQYRSSPLFTRRKYYTLIFTYRANNRTIKSHSEDQYILPRIEKDYEPRQAYRIWVNPKNLQDFRVKRFSGAFAGFLIIAVFGTGLLSVVIPLLFRLAVV